MGILPNLSGLLTVVFAPAVLYMLLMCAAAAVAMGSKKKFRRDMAWKIFNTLARRRPDPPALPPSVEDKPQK
ncbi:hypothetical protein [Streptosporangium sp. NPDC020145]|uniref:hypothetical protein n=1 Tax=Streptosporangium sp. NPDC020145 TaxID=3154694 RepID=UPI003424563D